MPSVSKKQQNFFRLVKAYKDGKLAKKDVGQGVVDAAEGMTKKQISHFADHRVKKHRVKRVDEMTVRTDEKLDIKPVDLNNVKARGERYLLYPFEQALEYVKNCRRVISFQVLNKGTYFLTDLETVTDTIRKNPQSCIRYNELFVAVITDGRITVEDIDKELEHYIRVKSPYRKDVNYFPDASWLKEIRPEDFEKYFNIHI